MIEKTQKNFCEKVYKQGEKAQLKKFIDKKDKHEIWQAKKKLMNIVASIWYQSI